MPVRYRAILDARWPGCEKVPYAGSTLHRASHDTVASWARLSKDVFSEAGQRAIRRELPVTVVCMYCRERKQRIELPAFVPGWDGRGEERSLSVSGSPVYRRLDTGAILRELTPGQAYDDGHPWFVRQHRARRRRSEYHATGDALTASALPVPIEPDDRIRAATGEPARPHSFFGWEWVSACRAAGRWLPMWHIVLPTSVPRRGAFSGDEVFPIYRFATNGQDQGNGYTTGWNADQWLDPTTMTLTPSINHAEGGPGAWHGWLTRGELTPA